MGPPTALMCLQSSALSVAARVHLGSLLTSKRTKALLAGKHFLQRTERGPRKGRVWCRGSDVLTFAENPRCARDRPDHPVQAALMLSDPEPVTPLAE